MKLRIIAQNLYGVDIDAFTGKIEMLRLWLSLAVEYDGEKPKPIPKFPDQMLRLAG